MADLSCFLGDRGAGGAWTAVEERAWRGSSLTQPDEIDGVACGDGTLHCGSGSKVVGAVVELAAGATVVAGGGGSSRSLIPFDRFSQRPGNNQQKQCV